MARFPPLPRRGRLPRAVNANNSSHGDNHETDCRLGPARRSPPHSLFIGNRSAPSRLPARSVKWQTPRRRPGPHRHLPLKMRLPRSRPPRRSRPIHQRPQRRPVRKRNQPCHQPTGQRLQYPRRPQRRRCQRPPRVPKLLRFRISQVAHVSGPQRPRNANQNRFILTRFRNRLLPRSHPLIARFLHTPTSRNYVGWSYGYCYTDKHVESWYWRVSLMVTETGQSSTQDPRRLILVPGGVNPTENVHLGGELWGNLIRSSHHMFVPERSLWLLGFPTVRPAAGQIAMPDGWAIHWPPFPSENADVQNVEPEQVGLQHGERSKSPLWRRQFLPILIATVGGVLLGALFLLVAIAAFLIESWAYGVTFAFTAMGLTFGPVSLVVAYLRWDDRASSTHPNETE